MKVSIAKIQIEPGEDQPTLLLSPDAVRELQVTLNTLFPENLPAFRGPSITGITPELPVSADTPPPTAGRQT